MVCFVASLSAVENSSEYVGQADWGAGWGEGQIACLKSLVRLHTAAMSDTETSPSICCEACDTQLDSLARQGHRSMTRAGSH